MRKDRQAFGKVMLFEPGSGVHLPAFGSLVFIHGMYAVGELQSLASRLVGADGNNPDRQTEAGDTPGGSPAQGRRYYSDGVDCLHG